MHQPGWLQEAGNAVPSVYWTLTKPEMEEWLTLTISAAVILFLALFSCKALPSKSDMASVSSMSDTSVYNPCPAACTRTSGFREVIMMFPWLHWGKKSLRLIFGSSALSKNSSHPLFLVSHCWASSDVWPVFFIIARSFRPALMVLTVLVSIRKTLENLFGIDSVWK